MSKKIKQQLKTGATSYKVHKGGPSKMNYKDAKRRALALGMPFPEAVEADFNRLLSFIVNSTNTPDPSLIDKYDDWIDAQLDALGYTEDDPMRSYQLRYGYIKEKSPNGVKKKRIVGMPKVKHVREKDTNGLWKGTKKSYTFELASRGYSLERVTKRVQKKFPEALDKSIKQWWRSALKAKGLNPKDYINGKKKEG